MSLRSIMIAVCSAALSANVVFASVVFAQSGPQPDRGLAVTPQQKLEGTVVLGGKPAANAEVRVLFRKAPLFNGVSSLARETVERVAHTDDQGAFAIAIPAWRWITVWAHDAGRKHASVPVDGIRAPKTDLRLELVPTGTLSGRLHVAGHAPHAPIDFWFARIAKDEHAAPIELHGTTTKDGRFEVTGVLPGRWSMLLTGDYRLRLPIVAGSMDEAPMEALDIEVELGQRFSCSLTKSGGAGKPIANAHIEFLDALQRYECRSDSAGNFTIVGAPSGPGVTLLIDAPGVTKFTYTLPPGLSPDMPAPQVRISPPKGVASFGRIVDMNGRPVAGLDIVWRGLVHAQGISVHDISVLTRTDADGKFGTTRLDQNGLFEAFAIKKDGEAQRFAVVDLRPAKHHPDLGTIQLGAHRVEVTVKLRSAVPAPYEMRVYGPKIEGRFAEYLPLVPTGKGTWLTPSLLEGEYAIFAVSPTLGIGRAEAVIKAARQERATTDATLVLAEPRKLEGIVTDAAGRPAKGVTVALAGLSAEENSGNEKWSDIVAIPLLDKEFPEAKFPRSVKTDKDGKFTLWCHEASGNWDIIARSNPGPSAGPGGQAGPEGGGTVRLRGALKLPMPIRIQIR